MSVCKGTDVFVWILEAVVAGRGPFHFLVIFFLVFSSEILSSVQASVQRKTIHY